MILKRLMQLMTNSHHSAEMTADTSEPRKYSVPEQKPAFNLVHILGTSGMHGLQGYRELIETVAWGLETLGADVTTTENQLQTDRVNIIFGAQVLPLAQIEQLPSSTIIYNLEQMAGLDLTGNPVARAIAARFQIWDYSASNVTAWQKLKPASPPCYVPIGWAPILQRIPRSTVQDIDILIYGKPGPRRLQVFNDLCQRGFKCVFVCGLYGQARDELVARAKIVLNINLYEHSRIFEIVRVSYLLANAKAVVADIQGDTDVESGLEEAVAFVAPEKIVETCVQLLRDDELRHALEQRGQRIMEQRNIVPILQATLAQSQQR